MGSVGSAGLVQDTGFAVIPEVFDVSEIHVLASAVATGAFGGSRAGARHLMRSADVRRLASDARLVSLARECLKAEPIAFRATLFDKSLHNNWLVVWHQDTALPLRARRDLVGWGPWSIKAGVAYAHAPATALARVIALRVHLDDSRSDNGPLRVLPGTHTHAVLSDTQIERLARDVVSIECVVPAGGVVAMRPLLVHGSSKAASGRPRRVLHIEYADGVEVDDGLELAIA